MVAILQGTGERAQLDSVWSDTVVGSSVVYTRESELDSVRRLRRTEYEHMVAHGLLEDERVELLEGQLVTVSPHGPDHAEVVTRLAELLTLAAAGRARVRVQCAFSAGDSLPEPDLAVVPRGTYAERHPSEAWLIVEVARTSLPKDRGIKARIYAAAGVPEYWVVDLAEERIEVRCDPDRGGYQRTAVYRSGDRLEPTRLSGVSIDISTLFSF